MLEKDFQDIWERGSFDTNALETADKMAVSIIKRGVRNHFSGPDFLDCWVKIDGIHWFGNIELHMHESDWFAHNHHKDPAYNNVVLHVFLIDGKPATNSSGTLIPSLNLSTKLIGDRKDLPLPTHHWDWYAKKRRAKQLREIEALYHQKGNDWRTAALIWTCISLFRPQNDLPAFRLFTSLPINKLENKPPSQIASILLYRAGMFTWNKSAAFQRWIEQGFLPLQHNVPSICAHEWKRAGTRPANRPEIRLSQAALLVSQWDAFSSMIQREMHHPVELIDKVRQLLSIRLDVPLPNYRCSQHLALRILLNGLIPAAMLYHQEYGSTGTKRWWLELASKLPAESNARILPVEQSTGACRSAEDSQGILQWLDEQDAQKTVNFGYAREPGATYTKLLRETGVWSMRLVG